MRPFQRLNHNQTLGYSLIKSSSRASLISQAKPYELLARLRDGSFTFTNVKEKIFSYHKLLYLILILSVCHL